MLEASSATARARRVLVRSLWLVAALAGTAQAADVEIKVLSNRADLVSGGDALVEVLLPPGSDPASLKVDVEGRDVSSDVVLRANGRIMGRVTGLAERANVLTAKLGNGTGARLTVTNFPNGGPVFSGPQIQPWPCLAGALDAKCNQPARYAFQYMSTSPARRGFQAYNPASPPTDVAMVTNDEGRTVPYIVRVETGHQDRGQYQIAVLFDPSKPWDPWAPQAGWNGKTYVTGGSGCGTHHGETTAPGVVVEDPLKRGFMVFSTALDHNTQNCNLVVQAESLMMVKERIVEMYGPIRYTIASGCSGGAIYQQQAANNYPGLFDGILPNCSFPDSWSTAVEVVDCRLLVNYFAAPTKWAPGVAWPANQQAAVEGHPGPNICESWINVYGFDQVANPRAVTTGLGLQSCNVAQGVGPDKAYDPTTNPKGVRCDLSSYFINQLGTRPDGIANRPADNVGVQYGLGALLDGSILPSQFVDLNVKLGGLDYNYDPVTTRTEADAPALAVTYRGGLFNMGNNMHLPIIDLRGHDVEEIHHDYRSYVMRARLDRSNGHHDNQVIWTGPAPLVGDTAFAVDALNAMDAWLKAIEADKSAIGYQAKVKKNKPAAAHDLCTNGSGEELPAATCLTLYPYYAEPRMVAGEPFTGDVLKCQRKPFDASAYTQTVPFTAAELQTLRTLYKDGVCDYWKPGIDQQPTIPWMSYAAGPFGQPLGAVPVSVPFAGGLEPFTFLVREGVRASTFITSELKTMVGAGQSDIGITGAGGQYSINGGAFTAAPGRIAAGDKLAVRHVSAAAGNTATVSTVKVGSYSTDFRSVTDALDRVPDAFGFGTVTGAAPNTLVESQDITLAGYNTDIAIVPGAGVAYSLDRGATWSTAAGKLAVGQPIRVRHTSNDSKLGYTKTALKAGGVTGTFVSRTR